MGNSHPPSYSEMDIVKAANDGSLERVSGALRAGVHVDTTNKDGVTALMVASSNGREVVVEALLKGGATVDMQDEDGYTALMLASAKGHEVVVEALLKAGATVDMQQENGGTALRMASGKGHEVVVEALLKAGATVDMQDKDGCTALMLTSRDGHQVVVEALLKAGATVDMQTKTGLTALMCASSEGHEVVVEALLKAGATVDMQAKYGWTALMLASSNGREVVVEALLKAGATVDMQTKNGNTALSLAKSEGHLGVVELLRRASIQPTKMEKQRVDDPHAATGTEGEGKFPPVIRVEPGHSKLESDIEQVQSPSARSKEGKIGDEKTTSVLQRRCTTLEHRLKQEQDEKRCIQEHSEQLVQDMTTAQRQLQQQLAQEREAIQAKEQLERQLQHQIQQLQQRLDSATTDKQQLQQRLTTATTDNQQLQQRLTTATTDNQQLQQRLTHARAELQSLQDIEPWKISRSKVEIQAEIGVGGWGSVSKGTVRVAVKKLHRLLLSQHNVDRIQREMRMLAQLRHPNLVQFIGVVFDEAALRIQASPMIITELLEMNLRTAYEGKLEFNKLSIFQDVARALNYLHSRHDPIIHRDISAPNILLEALPNRAWKGKVSDLGSANLAKLARTLAEGAIIYAAPETMPHQAHSPRAPKLLQTTKVDVYSYGVLLCEVATSRFPDPDHYPDMLEQVQREWPSMHGLIVSCTQFNPEERPTIADVHSRLSHLSQ